VEAGREGDAGAGHGQRHRVPVEPGVLLVQDERHEPVQRDHQRHVQDDVRAGQVDHVVDDARVEGRPPVVVPSYVTNYVTNINPKFNTRSEVIIRHSEKIHINKKASV